MFDINALKKKPVADRYEYIGARVNRDLKDRLAAYCEIHGVTTSSLIVAMIEDLIGQENKEDKIA